MKQNYYSVHKGFNPGIYKTWAECKSQVDGYSCSSFKKCSTLSEAEYFLKYGMTKKNPTIDDFFKNKEKKKNAKSKTEQKQINIDVYTDGDKIVYNNKQFAGYGIYFPNINGKEKYFSRRLDDENKTNNRAELLGVISALEIVNKLNKNVLLNIYTDSQYVIQCMGETGLKYQKTGFKRKNGTFYPNHDLIKKGLELLENIKVRWFKVKSHTNNNDKHSIGNSIADKLAMYGTIQDYLQNNDLSEYKVELGKFKGKTIYDLPTEYRKWIMETTDLHERYGLLYRSVLYQHDMMNGDKIFTSAFEK